MQATSCLRNETLCILNASDVAAENLTEEEVDVVEYLKIDATELRLNPNYIKFYLIYFNFFVNSLIPFVLLIILNCFMYRTVSQQEIELTVIRTLCGVSTGSLAWFEMSPLDSLGSFHD